MKKIYSTKHYIATVAMFAMTASVAFAWTAPTATAPAGNVPAPVNTGATPQTKSSSFSVIGNLMASAGVFGNFINGLQGHFGFMSFSPSTDILLAKAGVNGAGLIVNNLGKLLAGSGNTTTGSFNGIVVDPAGDVTIGNRLSWINKGLGVSSAGTTYITGPFRISSGNPGLGKVLTSDAQGNATWEGGAMNLGGNGGLVKYIKKQGSGSISAFCGGNDGNDASDDANWVAIGGGGMCQYGMKQSRPVISRSGSTGPSGTTPAIGWNVQCLEKAIDPIGATGNVIVSTGGNSSVAYADVVCMKRVALMTTNNQTLSSGQTSGGSSGGGTTPSSNLAWYDVIKTVGNVGQTCASWLSGYPNFTGNTADVRVFGSYAGQGVTVPVDVNSGCAYTRTVAGTTYCSSGSYGTKKTIVINGVSTDLAPTASCSGVDPITLGSAPGLASSTMKTQIRY